MSRRVCVVTGSRAEYGLLRRVMEGVRDSDGLTLQVVATAMHLAPEFGLTWRGIEEDGFAIDRKLEMLLSSDTAVGVAKSMGVGLVGFADIYAELAPDIVVVLGDRFETLAAVAAALVARIPVAHLHGGERTEGAFDESLRHAITKMSHLHFVAAEEYRQRVVQMGEDPQRVFLVGGLGIDALVNLSLLDRAALEASLDFRLGEKNLLITFHPATLDEQDAQSQMRELFAALDELKDTHLIFTLPNADTAGRALIAMVEDWVRERPHARAWPSLGQLRYLSCVAQVDGVVGNSSSGLLEVPTLKKGTVNIGERQRGRLRADSVIDCAPRREAIAAAIARLYDPDFEAALATVTNPYGDGGASERIVEVLRTHPLDGLTVKAFHDLDGAAAP